MYNILNHLKIAFSITSLIACVIIILYGIFYTWNINFFLGLLAIVTGFLYFFFIYYGFSRFTFTENNKHSAELKDERYLYFLGIIGIISIVLWVTFQLYIIYVIIFSSVWLITKMLSISSVFGVVFFTINALKK